MGERVGCGEAQAEGEAGEAVAACVASVGAALTLPQALTLGEGEAVPVRTGKAEAGGRSMTIGALLFTTHPTVWLHRAVEPRPTGPAPRGTPGGERVRVMLLARPPQPPENTPHRLVLGHSTRREGGKGPSKAKLK